MNTYRVTPHNDFASAKTVTGDGYRIDDGYLDIYAYRETGASTDTVATFAPGWSSIELVKANDQELPK